MPDQGASLEAPAERAQVAVLVAVADLGHLRGRGPSGRVIAGGREAEYARQPQIAALDTVLAFGIDQALRPHEPAARPSHLAERDQAQRQPERGPRGPEGLARVESELMKPLEGLERRLVAPGEDRRPCQALDVVGGERTCRARLRQRVIGIAPGPSLIGAPAAQRRVPHSRSLHKCA